LIVVIRSVIQIGVIVRIIGRPINRPGKLLKKDPMVTEATVTKATVDDNQNVNKGDLIVELVHAISMLRCARKPLL
jgi:hypothetical protein